MNIQQYTVALLYNENGMLGQIQRLVMLNGPFFRTADINCCCVLIYMHGHESAMLAVVPLQLVEKTLAHEVLGIKFPSCRVMRTTQIPDIPAVTECIIST